MSTDRLAQAAGAAFSGVNLSESEAPYVYIPVAIVTAIATLGVVLRCIARRKSDSKFSYDDYMVVFALILLYGLNTIIILDAALWGLGRHLPYVMYEMPPSTIPSFQKAGIAALVLYWTTCAAIKASLLLLYYRLFHPVRKFRWTVYVASFIVAGLWISLSFATIFQCVPIAGFWDRNLPATCVNLIGITTSSGLLTLFTDIMILALPIPMVWTLNTTKAQKVSLTGIFLIGAFVCITSIIRITKLFQVDSNDVTFRLLNVHVWTSVEASIGVLCACLPTLRPLFGRFLNKGSRERPLGLKSGGPGSRSATKEHFTRLADDHSRGPGLSSPNGGGNSSSSSGSPRSADSVQLEKLGVHSSPRLDRHSGTEDEESARFDDCSGQHNPRALEQPYAL